MVKPSCPIHIRIEHAAFDTAAETALLTAGKHEVGALVAFTGLCRVDEKLSALELEHYPGMAEAKIEEICREAAQKWPLMGIRVVHRVGKIDVGDNIVLVAATSAHRAAAFAGADYIMDFLKSRAPFWKKEHGADGIERNWVDAKESDEEALDRWT
ncbi:MAG: molybdenum cofactor biosynthesis protein MoaE [Rhizobiales bacterium]|nr:molybdenum cofactor biosynthesis protein MoaE [Hyphomicrobiales bacterium]